MTFTCAATVIRFHTRADIKPFYFTCWLSRHGRSDYNKRVYNFSVTSGVQLQELPWLP